MKIQNIDIIIENIINMLATNYPYKTDGIGESFCDWCENGDIFYNNEILNLNDKEECIKIMQKISPFVDALTNKLFEFYEKVEELKNENLQGIL